MTSNHPREGYEEASYDKMMAEVAGTLEGFVGPVTTFAIGTTLQVPDYSRYNWTFCDPDDRPRHHDEIFPKELEEARKIAADLFK